MQDELLQQALAAVRAAGVNLPDPVDDVFSRNLRLYHLEAAQGWLDIGTKSDGTVAFVVNLFSGKAKEGGQHVTRWRPGDHLDDQLLELLRLFARVDHEALLNQARAVL